jgi:hypothetical protein
MPFDADVPVVPRRVVFQIPNESHSGVTQEEVEEVLAENYETATQSRSSGQPEAFGWTTSGKYLTVVFEQVSDDPLAVYPITACEVRPPGPRKRRKRR